MGQKTNPVQDPVFLINVIDFVGARVLASKNHGGVCNISCALPKMPNCESSSEREIEKCVSIFSPSVLGSLEL